MRTTEILLFAPFLKTSKFIPACIYIYIIFGQNREPTDYSDKTIKGYNKLHRKDKRGRSKVLQKERVETHGLHR